MRLAMVQLVLVNLKSFYPMAGYDLLGETYTHPLSKCRPIAHQLSPLILLPSFCLCVWLRPARGLSAVPRRAEDAAALGAGAAEAAGDLRGAPLQVHLHPPAG